MSPRSKAKDSPTDSHISTIGAANLRQQVRRALEAAIVAGELKPGELYSAPALGERFGVSATPVREAMLELSKDGFVVAERNRGFRVLEVSERDLDEISKIRLTDLVDRLRRQTRLFGLDQLVESGRLVESAQEHLDLIDAMRARDEAA